MWYDIRSTSKDGDFQMTLYEKLQLAQSEEDVKDIYIKALGLKRYSKNLIDIQTKEIWFEAKQGKNVSIYSMFTELLYYVKEALKKGEAIPPFLCVIDAVKAALMETKNAIPLLEKKNIKWGKSASQISKDALDTVSQHIGTYFLPYQIETHEQAFIEAVRTAIKSGKLVRRQITPNNLRSVFDQWMKMIGDEIDDEDESLEQDDYALLFFADIMTDGTTATHDDLPAELLHRGNAPVFSLRGKLYKLSSLEGYWQFWAIYDRPPKEEHRNYLLERRDSLIPLDSRMFKGAYYTPLHVVDRAYELLDQTLGDDWQKEYIVWDMCCGVGNLETKHNNPRNVYMSTLDQPDVDVMVSTRTCVGAERFQYDYLNDDITDDGNIDYSLTEKVPKKLRKAISEGKKILVLINPPYAEATNADNTSKGVGARNKAGVAKTKWAEVGMRGYGKASNELFTQFVVRIAKEIPKATLAMFSKLKYINSTNFEQFRNNWNASYLNGFIVHSKAFDGLTGDFPIGFLIWQTDQNSAEKTPIKEISTEVINKAGSAIGEKKFYNIPTEDLLNQWIRRPRASKVPCLPLSSALKPSPMLKPRVKTWSEDAIAYMCAGTNDIQNAVKYVYILSSVAARGNGFYVTPKNLAQAAVVFTVSRIIKPTWINDRDQFLQPTCELPEWFYDDCLLWMLFNGNNVTASANGLEWNGKKWDLINHFVPYTEQEVNAKGRFESDFMSSYLSDRKLSSEATSVLDAGRDLWKAFFAVTDNKSIRDEFKLNRPDVGWYQIRNALEKRNESGSSIPVSFEPFNGAYMVLTEKIRPLVYEYGFLR